MRLPVSLTKAYTVTPTTPTATAVGALKAAAVPVPSAQLAEPEPASVVTANAALIRRSRLLPLSTMSSVLAAKRPAVAPE